MFDKSLPPVVGMRAHVLITMFGSSLPPVVCATGGKDEPNIVNKT
jgi:hypothetical protein